MIKLALGIKAGSDGEVSDGGNGVDSDEERFNAGRKSRIDGSLSEGGGNGSGEKNETQALSSDLKWPQT